MEQKQAIADRLKQSNNILVTVSNNPSVDQLSSCIGLTLALNKMGKHATAVFSGNVPSTIEFLQPEKTIEKNTDSLRDFIIALDKAKADKLRYKVEDKVVKIFITPYKTSISEKDLDFSQGDFNVDVVVAIGVHQQGDLDQAITAHGRILHDAVVTTINTKPGGELGTMNWLDPNASSLSELIVQLLDVMDKQVIDGQMATALLTGIVAETNRFSNEKTTPITMSISAELMGAGANQQLVATKLEEPQAPPPQPVSPVKAEGASLQGEGAKPESHQEAGTLEITHTREEATAPSPQEPPKPPAEPQELPNPQEPPLSQIKIDEHGQLQNVTEISNHSKEPLIGGSIDPNKHMASSHMILQPPALGGQLSASGMPEEETTTDPLSSSQPGSQALGASSGFGQPAASASGAPTAMPFLPPSMTPGGTVQPAPQDTSAPQPQRPFFSEPQTAPAPTPVPAPVPEPPAMQAPAPAPTSTFPEPATSPTAVAQEPAGQPAPSQQPTSETLSQIEADVNSPHLQGSPAAAAITPSVAPPASAVTPNPGFAPSPAPVPEPQIPPQAVPAESSPAPQPPQPSAGESAPAPAVSADLESARDAVLQAIASEPESSTRPEPIKALNANPLGAPLHENEPFQQQMQPPAPAPAPAPANFDATANPTFTLPDADNPGTQFGAGAMPPPPNPPPMMPNNFGQPGQ